MKKITKSILQVIAFLVTGGNVLHSQNNPTTQTTGGKVWGEIFGDYAYVGRGDSAGRGNGNVQYKGLGSGSDPVKGQNSFEVRRIYLGFNYYVNEKFSAVILLDYNGSADGSGDRILYLKNAYLAWKNIFKGSDFQIGEQTTNSFSDGPYSSEQLFGYRSIERTLLDMHKVDASADMGAKLTGRIWTSHPLDSTRAPSLIGYSIMVGDNTGFLPVPGFATVGTTPNSTTDLAKKFRGNLYVNTLNGKLTLGLYGDYLTYGNNYYHNRAFANSVYTFKSYAFFKHPWFGVGFELFQQTLTNGEFIAYKPGTGTNDTTNAAQAGLSVYGYGILIKDKLKLFARYDFYNPDTKYTNNANITYTDKLVSANTYSESFISAGLDWVPTKDKKVHIMPNVWYDGINNGKGSDNLKSDYYLVYRLTFYIILDGRKSW